MPLMYGIAAFAVLANGFDQTGVDPQIDKQYAIVKSGQNAPPAVPVVATDEGLGTHSANANGISFRSDSQDGNVSTGATINVQGQLGTAAGQTVIIQGQTAPTAPAIVTTTGQLTAPRVAMAPGLTLWSGGDNLSRLKGMDRLVSVQFTNATAADVLKWLSKQNVNFVANVDRLPKSKITMSVNHVPLHEALETVAESLGGSWNVKGSTLIFSSGMFHNMSSFAPAQAGTLRSFNSAPFGDARSFGDMKLFSQMNDKDWKAFQFDQKKMNEDMARQLKDLKGFSDDGKAFTYKMDPKQMEQFKAYGMMKDGKPFTYKIDPKQLEQFKAFGLMKDGKAFTYKMDPKQLEELKALGMTKDGKTFKMDPKQMEQFKGFKDGKWDAKSFGNMKGLGDAKLFKGMTFKKIDVEKFRKSMSNSQRELMKKQGYLKFDDLTKEQKAMIFDGSVKDLGDNFTFVFSNDGEKITIKK